MPHLLRGARIFDGTRLIAGHSLLLDSGRIAGILPGPGPEGIAGTDLAGGILAPGLIDLQVNGGGGHMIDGATDAAALADIAAAHVRLGALGILPTLITDRPEATRAVIDATRQAVQAGIPGILGLHLEGPHLDPRRKGAHDAALVRPMSGADLDLYLRAAAVLPALMVTLAPESATAEQISRLRAAGVVVSLGHSDCTHAQATAAFAAGAGCITHLFNAMSQLGNRAPGLVGAALDLPVQAGLIADGLHVDPATMRVALAAKPQGIFLVSDCMAVAGTAQSEFQLNGRRILRREGRLTLEDGTLAGADLTLPQAMSNLVHLCGTPVERALAMATSIPARVIGRDDEIGHLLPGRDANLVHLADDLTLRTVWRGGVALGA